MAVTILRRHFRLHRAQLHFRQSNATFRGYCGGIGSGKSFVGALDLLRRAQPGRLYLVAAPTYPMLRDASLRMFLALARDLLYLKEFAKGEMTATLGNGAEVLFRSTDDPDRLRGPNLSGIWLDEASLMEQEVFEVLIGRLREAGQQGWLSATFTPKGRAHWTHEVFTKANADTLLVRSRTRDNPHLPATFYDKVRGQYTSYLAAQELEGEFLDTPGALFRRDWFEIVESAPAELRQVRAWDLAATDAKKADDPDWTAGVLLGKSKDNVYYVLDVRHVRSSPRQVEALVRQTAELDGRGVPIWIEQEPGASGVTLIDHYTRNVLAGWTIKGERSTGDKPTRAQPLAAQAEAGNVKLVRAPWNKDFLDEAEQFPLVGKNLHDDMVDATALAFQKLSLGPWRKLAIF